MYIHNTQTHTHIYTYHSRKNKHLLENTKIQNKIINYFPFNFYHCRKQTAKLESLIALIMKSITNFRYSWLSPTEKMVLKIKVDCSTAIKCIIFYGKTKQLNSLTRTKHFLWKSSQNHRSVLLYATRLCPCSLSQGKVLFIFICWLFFKIKVLQKSHST